MSYTCQHFAIHELVPPETLQALGEARCWWLLDEGMLRDLDRLREDLAGAGLCGKITINNWHWGGQLKYSGFRPADCTEGAKHSQHRCGRGFDLKPDGKWDRDKADQVRQYIRDHRDRYPAIRSMETGITWVHVDGRNHEQFLEFDP